MDELFVLAATGNHGSFNFTLFPPNNPWASLYIRLATVASTCPKIPIFIPIKGSQKVPPKGFQSVKRAVLCISYSIPVFLSRTYFIVFFRLWNLLGANVRTKCGNRLPTSRIPFSSQAFRWTLITELLQASWKIPCKWSSRFRTRASVELMMTVQCSPLYHWVVAGTHSFVSRRRLHCYDTAIGLETCLFHQLWLSMEYQEWVSINAPRHSVGGFCFKLILTTAACM